MPPFPSHPPQRPRGRSDPPPALSFLSPWDPAPSRVTTPPDSTPDPLAHSATWPGSLTVAASRLLAGPRKSAPRPCPALRSVLPRPLVAAAPAPAPQAATVASPPPLLPGLPRGSSFRSCVRPPVCPLVRRDRPVLGGGRRLRAGAPEEWNGGPEPPGGARPIPELEEGRARAQAPPLVIHTHLHAPPSCYRFCVGGAPRPALSV